MSASVGVFGEFAHINHDAGPQDLTDIEGNPVEMPNKANGGGFRVEGEFVIPQESLFDSNRVEVLGFRVAFGFTAQGRVYPTDVYGPAQCEEYVQGGVGNVGSAGNCGVTGDKVDTSAAHYDRWSFDFRYQPRVWIFPETAPVPWDVSPTLGLRFDVYTGKAQLLQEGAYGMVDLKHRAPLIVAGVETGITVVKDLIGQGDLRIVGGYTYDRGQSYAEDTGGDDDPFVEGTGNHTVRAGVVARW